MVIFTRRWDGNDFDRGHHYFRWFFNGFAATGPSPLNVLHGLVFDLSFLTFVFVCSLLFWYFCSSVSFDIFSWYFWGRVSVSFSYQFMQNDHDLCKCISLRLHLHEINISKWKKRPKNHNISYFIKTQHYNNDNERRGLKGFHNCRINTCP